MTLLRHLALRCRDMEPSAGQFYEMLGLRFVDYRPKRDALDLTDGTLNVTLIQHEGPERAPLEEGHEFVHFGLLVEDARATLLQLKSAGATFLRENVKERLEMDEMIPSGSFKVQDPDGNVIDISGNRDEWRGARALAVLARRARAPHRDRRGGGPGGLPLAVVLVVASPLSRGQSLCGPVFRPGPTPPCPTRGRCWGWILRPWRGWACRRETCCLLHHPQEQFLGEEENAEFRAGEPLDVLLLTREEVGGLGTTSRGTC